MNILALETATDACSCALNVDGVITEAFVIAPQRHADLILSMIDQLLKTASLPLSAIDAIAFGAGPGGFMGVRIATAVAQGLGYAQNCPLIPISTLQCLAQVAYSQTKSPCVLAGWDARMSAIYWGTYQVDQEGFMQPLHPDRLTAPAEVAIPTASAWLAAGNAWSVYQNELPPQLTQSIRADLIHPHASALAQLAAAKYKRGEVIPPEQAEPIYLREAVQIKRKD